MGIDGRFFNLRRGPVFWDHGGVEFGCRLDGQARVSFQASEVGFKDFFKISVDTNRVCDRVGV